MRLALTRIAEELGQIAGQIMPLVKGAQRQKAGIVGDQSAGKIKLSGTVTVKGEVQLWYTSCRVADAPKGPRRKRVGRPAPRPFTVTS